VNEPDAFLDTSVLIRHIMGDDANHSPRATAFLRVVAAGERAVRISDTVVFEAAFVLGRVYKMRRDDIRDALLPIIDLPGIVLPGKRIFARVFELFLERSSLSFADCYHLALTERLELGTIVAFDQAMGRVPGIVREEP